MKVKRLPLDIERYYLSEYGRKSVLVPSGRFGIYAIIRSLFSPGDKIIISPVTCKTVILALFSGGVIPVFVDVDAETGNIDVEQLTDKLLSSVVGIIATNLYGTPDRAKELRAVCNKYGLFLLEDCSHIVEANIEGKRIGTIGDAAVFSFYKFLKVQGGVVLSDNEDLLNKISSVVENEGESASRLKSFTEWAKSGLVRHVPGVARLKGFIGSGLLTLKSTLSIDKADRTTQSLTYEGVAPLDTASLKPLHEYLSYNGKQYHILPTKTALEQANHVFRSIGDMIARKRNMNNKLIDMCPLELKKAAYDAEYCNLVIPYFSDNRDEIVNRLASEKGIDVWYVYNPPLSDVFDSKAFINAQKNPDIAREWGKRVLPINSNYTDEYLEIISKTIRESSRQPINDAAGQGVVRTDSMHR